MNESDEIRRLKNRIIELEKEVDLLRNQLSKVAKAGPKPLNDEETIKYIFEAYQKDNSLGDIASQLNKRGVKTKRGGKWYKATVKYILQNHQYVDKGYITEAAFVMVQQQLKNNRLWGKEREE